MMDTNRLVVWLLASLPIFLGADGCILSGCTANQQEPIQFMAQTFTDKVVAPAVAKAAEGLESTSAAITGTASLINPGYRIQGFGMFGTGIAYDCQLTVVGVGATLAGATQGERRAMGVILDKPESSGSTFSPPEVPENVTPNDDGETGDGQD